MIQQQQSSSSTLTAPSIAASISTNGSDCEYASVPIIRDHHSASSTSYPLNKGSEDQNYRRYHLNYDYNEFQHQQLKNYQNSNGISLSSSSSSNSSNSNCLIEHPQQQNGRASSEIFEEIQRFESVHPCIYALYNLIESVPDLSLQEQLREQVIRIEDAFVNSEEWTLSRAVHELKLGVVGSLDSGKTSLVHFFLTERATTEESPEGGRFKKEVTIDGRSYLLLIRDEGCNSPEFQFTHWIDGVIIVFAAESRESYLIALQYFKKMTAYRNLNDIPVFLVGILDPISGRRTPTREISTEEARMASVTMKMSNYFECYTYKPNVYEIFHTVSKKLLQQQRRHYRSTLSQSSSAGSGTNNFGSNYGSNRVLQLEKRQLCAVANNACLNNYYHQRSVSALPAQEFQQASSHHHFNGASTSLSNQHSTPTPGSARDPGSIAVLRRSHKIPQSYYQQQQNSLQSARAGSLANVPVSCSASVSTFYQDLSSVELPRSDSFGQNNSEQQVPFPFRRESRDSGRFFSSFLPSSSGQHHSTSTFAAERISTPDFASSTVGAGLSPAYSHSSLASQFSCNNGTSSALAPQYSRSSSSVVANNQYHHHMYHHNYRDDGGTLGSGAASFMSSTALLNNVATHNTTGTSTNLLLPTPSTTPSTQRKNRRISNIFRGNKESHSSNLVQTPEEHLSSKHQLQQQQALAESVGMGVGREIPIKEGVLYKKSHRGLNREWKKKYVCLYADGRIRYHPTHKDYRNNTDAKEIKSLLTSTVRVSGRQRPRATNRHSLLPLQQSAAALKDGLVPDDAVVENGGVSTPGEGGTSGNSDGGEAGFNAALVTSTSSVIGQLHHKDLPQHGSSAGTEKCLPTKLPATNISAAAEAKKKRTHKLLGSGTKKDDDEEDLEFEIISSNQKRWEFSASSTEERDEWVRLIEEIIEKCIQSQQSQKQQQSSRAHGDRAEVQALKDIPGNNLCADCSQPRPDWASLNLGTLICIECSGIHRNLGSHISRVRSLDLDDWPMEYLMVIQAIGNRLANSIWELNASLSEKPTPDSSREQKESWIKMKYEQKLYLPTISSEETISRQLIDAVLSKDLKKLLTLLPYATEKDVNRTIGANVKAGAKNNGSSDDMRTPLHLSCSIGAAEILQLLIWHNADIRSVDESQRSALWYARLNGSRGCEAILLNAGLSDEYIHNNDESKNSSSKKSTNSGDLKPSSNFNSSSIGRVAGLKTGEIAGKVSADISKHRYQSDFAASGNIELKDDPKARLLMQTSSNGLYKNSPSVSNSNGVTSALKRNSDTSSFQCLPASVI